MGRGAALNKRGKVAVSEHRDAFGGSGGRVVWRNNNLDPRALAWHASRGMSCLTGKASLSTSRAWGGEIQRDCCDFPARDPSAVRAKAHSARRGGRKIAFDAAHPTREL